MLKIEVDEAYAFDMLAILELKLPRSGADAANYVAFLACIESQVGVEKTREILHSQEYAKLLGANGTVFNMIERIGAGQQLDALEVHRANMERFHGKKALQEAFFGGSLAERKTATSLVPRSSD